MDCVYHFGLIKNWHKVKKQALDIFWRYSNQSRSVLLQNPNNVDLWHSLMGDKQELIDQTQFTYLNSMIANTLLGNIIQVFPSFRSRILLIPTGYCYPAHDDSSRRIHIPIVTNSNSGMLFFKENKFFHLSEGHVYLTDTTVKHTYLNAGYVDRINLVISVPMDWQPDQYLSNNLIV